MSKKISDLLPQTEILAQLAEEASELAQAALKLRRALDGTNPTPKSVNECWYNLSEELADIKVCIDALKEDDSVCLGEIEKIADIKTRRWFTRLEERERKKSEQVR